MPWRSCTAKDRDPNRGRRHSREKRRIVQTIVNGTKESEPIRHNLTVFYTRLDKCIHVLDRNDPEPLVQASKKAIGLAES